MLQSSQTSVSSRCPPKGVGIPALFKQAEKVIEKFGGTAKLANALNCDPATIYKWTYPKDKGGTDGLIPSSTMGAVLNAADVLGIDLTSDDIDPREDV